MLDNPEPGKRIDQFLAAQFPDQSRSEVQRWIARGRFTVNGRVVAKDYVLKVDDRVEETHTISNGKETQETVRTAVDIPIIFEDDDIVLVNKPIGVLVHPTPKNDEWTLVDFVREHCGSLDGVGEDPERPGIVHRLDRDVSGVMVIAKTPAAWRHLKEQFMQRTITKEYRAIVFGQPSQPTGTITFKIAHSQTRGGKMAARPEHELGREAWTEYEVLQTFKRYALLRVFIRTGRTHQIRAHLAAIDHPVVGDMIYGAKRTRLTKGIERVYLHALRLEVTHPGSGERQSFEAPMPQEFERFMQA